MNMKYCVVIPDGMADYPIESLGGKTPLEAAETPNMDRVAVLGRQGTCRTVPEGMDPGSDVAIMSVLGIDPARSYSGRAPLEAASMGIELGPQHVAFRCNLVTVVDDTMTSIIAPFLNLKFIIALSSPLFAGEFIAFPSQACPLTTSLPSR